MKVYLIEVSNYEDYEDYHARIEKVFTTFRGASQWLIDQGFEPYFEYFLGEGRLKFYWEESDEYMARCEGARIIEMEVHD